MQCQWEYMHGACLSYLMTASSSMSNYISCTLCSYKNGMFLPSPIIGRVLNPRPWHSCSALEAKAITVICDDGKPNHYVF